MNWRRSSLAIYRKYVVLRSSQRSSILGFMDDVFRKDFFTILGLWLVIECFSFVIMPFLMGISLDARFITWLSLSFPLGIGGAFLLGSSSRFLAINSQRYSNHSKGLRAILGQVIGLVGFGGVMFPFLMVTGTFFARIFSN